MSDRSSSRLTAVLSRRIVHLQTGLAALAVPAAGWPHPARHHAQVLEHLGRILLLLLFPLLPAPLLVAERPILTLLLHLPGLSWEPLTLFVCPRLGLIFILHAHHLSGCVCVCTSVQNWTCIYKSISDGLATYSMYVMCTVHTLTHTHTHTRTQRGINWWPIMCDWSFPIPWRSDVLFCLVLDNFLYCQLHLSRSF